MMKNFLIILFISLGLGSAALAKLSDGSSYREAYGDKTCPYAKKGNAMRGSRGALKKLASLISLEEPNFSKPKKRKPGKDSEGYQAE